MKKILKKKGVGDIGPFSIFLNPEVTLSHNRPISLYDLSDSKLSNFIQDYSTYFREKGLNTASLEKLDLLIWEYYLRTNTHLEDVGNFVQKTIETSSHRVQLGNDSINTSLS